MEQKSMTALVSAFSRAYHSENNETKIFDDYISRKLFSNEEYKMIEENFSNGIKFFNPTFSGTKAEAIRWIVNNQLSPTPLARACFAENSLENSIILKTNQYLIFASGYDTFAYRNKNDNLRIFEIDKPIAIEEKIKRIKNANIEIPDNLSYIKTDFNDLSWEKDILKCESFDKSKPSFCSLLGIVYYLKKDAFINMLKNINKIIPQKSSIVFDYPNKNNDNIGLKQEALAKGANETMCYTYSYEEMEKALEDSGFLIYEHLDFNDINSTFFKEYNKKNPNNKINAFRNVNYCLAVKK